MLEQLKDYPQLLAGMGLVVALLPVVKLLYWIFHSNRIFKIQGFDLLSRSMKEESEVRELVVEQLFLAHFKIKASFEVFQLLMRNQYPSESIELYRFGERYLVVEDGELKFKGKFNDSNRRRYEQFFRPILMIVLYFVFCTSGALLILWAFTSYQLDDGVSSVQFIRDVTFWFLLLISGGLMFVFGIRCLLDKSSIVKAEQLMLKQSNVTNTKLRWYY